MMTFIIGMKLRDKAGQMMMEVVVVLVLVGVINLAMAHSFSQISTMALRNKKQYQTLIKRERAGHENLLLQR